MNKVHKSCTGPKFPPIQRLLRTLSGTCLIVPKNSPLQTNLKTICRNSDARQKALQKQKQNLQHTPVWHVGWFYWNILNFKYIYYIYICEIGSSVFWMWPELEKWSMLICVMPAASRYALEKDHRNIYIIYYTIYIYIIIIYTIYILYLYHTQYTYVLHIAWLHSSKTMLQKYAFACREQDNPQPNHFV